MNDEHKEINDINGHENDFVMLKVIGCLVNKVASSSIVKVMIVALILAIIFPTMPILPTGIVTTI